MAIPRIDYQSLASQRWRLFESDGSPSNAGGVVSEDGYLEEFVAVTQFITEYYKDRIGAWKIWNEPDYLSTPGCHGISIALEGRLRCNQKRR
ncbi:MAG: hypothetical protein R2911_20845 [Caldilineaceae bacterium]